MANNENLKGHGFHERTASERREIAVAGGRASGEARRRKADFRRTLNLLLTAKIDSPEWTPLLEALGLDSTLESAVNAAMIKKALSGNVKAYEAIAKYSGQAAKTETDEAEQAERIKNAKARRGEETEEQMEDDGFLEALYGTAAADWTEEAAKDENAEADL